MGNSSSSKTSGNGTLSSSEGGDEANNPDKMSYFEMAKQGYQELVNAIIRPPRCEYETRQLGPNVFDFCGKTFYRQDFHLQNPRQLNFFCSMWQPTDSCRKNAILPCVIYMHGNSSARLEGLAQLSVVLSLGVTFFTFDFAGSGISEGEYVSLGAYEKDDLKVVVEYLRSLSTVSTIALWGRSMGATTALLHGERDPSIAGMVLDSAFSDLTVLAEEMVEKGRQQGLFAPSLIVKMAIRFIRSSVQKTANFDIKDLSPIDHADKCFIPALFAAAENDTFVAPHHSRRIYEKYAGDKNLIIVDGDHNSARPRFFYDSVSIFLTHTLQIPDDWILADSARYMNTFPWMTGKGRARYVDLVSATFKSVSFLI